MNRLTFKESRFISIYGEISYKHREDQGTPYTNSLNLYISLQNSWQFIVKIIRGNKAIDFSIDRYMSTLTCDEYISIRGIWIRPVDSKQVSVLRVCCGRKYCMKTVCVRYFCQFIKKRLVIISWGINFKTLSTWIG